ncbi:chemotaxis protein CheB [Polaromonas sp. CG_9.11]|uniref:chemotaxis protein CheB n=1 Tax=Polaromonas sp. CG_9.11 TaxID=2787730 RepID=UPI0018CAC323|nr:chemotaxis protein CheB [Polaromonas sp. CG_9.11]MBG6075218.1 two-component system chemotaxis response regulator CheB [Polaromonas sp. CG_9.11]
MNEITQAKLQRVKAVVIGASAGGVDALMDILPGLPASFGVPLVVVLHLSESHHSQLAEIFQRRMFLQVREAADKETLVPGTLYFAPPGYHLLVETDHSLSLSCEAQVHFSRPSIDVLMESAADAYGLHLAGIVLTGANADGAKGLDKIGRQGGLTVVQDPAEARMPVMPEAAIRLRQPDLILDLKSIHRLLLEMGKNSC